MSVATLFVCLTLVLAARVAYGATADGLRFEAESMSKSSANISVVSDTDASGGQALRFQETDDLASKVVTFSADATALEIRARGNDLAGEVTYPQVRVFIDGTNKGNDLLIDEQLTSTYQTFTVPISEAQGAHTVRVQMAGWDAGDRLITDYVAFTYDAAAPPPPPPSEAPDCDATLQPGTDTVPETPSANTVYCLRAGNYYEGDKTFRITNPNVTFRSYPGETAEIRGTIRPTPTGDGFTLGKPGTVWPNLDGGVVVDGSYGNQNQPGYQKCPFGCDTWATQGIFVESDNVTIVGNEIKNRRPNGDTALAGQCVLITGTSDSDNSLIAGNFIHHCGQIPRNNHEHALYISGLQNSRIANNLVWEYADRGLQGYSSPFNVDVVGNVFAGGNASAGMHTSESATDVNMVNNVSAYNKDWNFYSGPTSSGSGNHLTGNCFGPQRLVKTDASVIESGSVTADPQFDSSIADGIVRVTNPECAAKLPAGSRFRP